MSTQRIKNLISKLITDSSSDKTLEEYLESMEAAGGTVKFTYDTDGCVDSLFISSAEMKKKFADLNPFSIQVDTTSSRKENINLLISVIWMSPATKQT